jgi:uncharacterized phiE125 gp8 family phage protein
MALILITPPAQEPISVIDALAHCRQDQPDPTIAGFIAAARAAVENYTHRALITQTWKYLRDGWPARSPAYAHEGYSQIFIPKPPFQSIVSFQYVDTAGVLQTLTAAGSNGSPAEGSFYGYQLDPGGITAPARLTPPWAVPWPPVRRIPNNVTLEFVCGYGANGPDPNDATKTIWSGQSIPADIITALKMQIAWLYEYRGDDKEAIAESDRLAPGVEGLLKPYRCLVV